ncbi:hypothetical protein X946_5566 [Burkholderia sp. ABCPW 111]|nr:hypothetical protein X946_5566 [Burkholderia sp. ABCPW 111]
MKRRVRGAFCVTLGWRRLVHVFEMYRVAMLVRYRCGNSMLMISCRANLN